MKRNLRNMLLLAGLLALGQGTLGALPTLLVPQQGQFQGDVVAVAYPQTVVILKQGVQVGSQRIQWHAAQEPQEIQFRYPQRAQFAYFHGDVRVSRVPSYAQMELRDLYPGVHLQFTALQDGHLEIQWTVEPGADPGQIRLQVPQGELVRQGTALRTPTFELGRLKAYQGVREIPVAFSQVDQDLFTLEVGDYDPHQPLVIDPDLTMLQASTFFGGDSTDEVSDIYTVFDTVYVVGRTNSPDLYTTPGVYDDTYNGGYEDVFVAKLSRFLDTLYAATFLGGSQTDWATGITQNSVGQIVVVGQTFSPDFPTVNGYQTTLQGPNDAFVALFSPDLQDLDASTLFGGTGSEVAHDVDVGPGDSVFVCGTTYSSNLPLVGSPLDSDLGNGPGGFLANFFPDLSGLYASTYVSGDNADELKALFVGEGRVYAAGYSSSIDIPLGSPTFDNTVVAQDAYIIGTDFGLSTVIGATFFSADTFGAPTEARGITIDDSVHNIIVTGFTNSTMLPIVGGFDSTLNGYGDAFIAIFGQYLDSLVASTYLGGSGDSEAANYVGLSFASPPALVVAGVTDATDMPGPHTNVTPYDSTYNGNMDAFVYLISLDLDSIYGFTYYGGSQTDEAFAASADVGVVYVVGYTESSGLPMAGTPFDSTFNGSKDGFIALFNNTGPPPVEVAEADVPHPGVPPVVWSPPFLRFSLDRAAYVGIQVLDVAGRERWHRSVGVLPAGPHQLTLPELAQGVSFLRVRIGSEVYTVKAWMP